MEINPELRGFVDAEGRFKAWPAKRSKQLLILDSLAALFETGRTYTPQEISELLGTAHTFSDPTMLRRELIELKVLERSADGRSYWKKTTEPNQS